MSPQIAIVLLVLGSAALLVGIWLAVAANRDRKTFEAAQRDLEAERQALGSSRGGKQRVAAPAAATSAPLPPPDPDPALLDEITALTKKLESREAELQRQLGDVREKLDAQKRKVAGLAKERDTLRQELESSHNQKPQTQVDQGLLVDLRMDLADALAQAEQYKAQLAKSSQRPSGPSKHDTPPQAPRLDQPSQPEITRQIDSDDIAASLAATAQLEEKLRAVEGELRELKKSARSESRKAMRDLDRQRRRAENNDKAFRVTQRELDAARARLKMLTLVHDTPAAGAAAPAAAAPSQDALAVEAQAPEAEPVADAPRVSEPSAELSEPSAELPPDTQEAVHSESDVQKEKREEEKTAAAPRRNEDDHETIEFDPKLMEAVVREAEAKAPEPSKALDAAEDLGAPEAMDQREDGDPETQEHEGEGAHEEGEPTMAAGPPAPEAQKTVQMPILVDADTTFEDIPLADEAMSIDDAWSVFMDDHDE